MVFFKKNKRDSDEKAQSQPIERAGSAPSYRGYAKEQVGTPGGAYQQEVLQTTLLEMEERANTIYAPHQRAAEKRQSAIPEKINALSAMVKSGEAQYASLVANGGDDREIELARQQLAAQSKELSDLKLKDEKTRARISNISGFEQDLAQLLVGSQPYRKGYARRRDEIIVAQQGMNLNYKQTKAALEHGRHQLRSDEANAMRARWRNFRDQKTSDLVDALTGSEAGEAILHSATKSGADLRSHVGRMANPNAWAALLGTKDELDPKAKAKVERIIRDLDKIDGVIGKWDLAAASASTGHGAGKADKDRTKDARKAFLDAVRSERSLVLEGNGERGVLSLGASEALGWASGKTAAAKLKLSGTLHSGRDFVTAAWGSRGMSIARMGVHGGFEALKTLVGMAVKIGQVAFQSANQLSHAMSQQDFGGVTHLASFMGQGGLTAGQSYLAGRQKVLGSRGKILERMGKRAQVAQERNRVREERQRSAAEEHDQALSNGYAHLNNVMDYLRLAESQSLAKTAVEEARIRERMVSAKDAVDASYEGLKQYPSMARILGFDEGLFHPKNVVKMGQEIGAEHENNLHDYLERAYEGAGLGIPSKTASHGDFQPIIDLGGVDHHLKATANGKAFETKNTRLVAVCHDGEIDLSLVGTHQENSLDPANTWGNSENALGERLGRMKASELARAMTLASEDKLGHLLHTNVVRDDVFEKAMNEGAAADSEFMERFAGRTRDSLSSEDQTAFDALLERRDAVMALKKESDLSPEELETVQADRVLHDKACRLIGVQLDGPRQAPPGTAPKYKPVEGGQIMGKEQMDALANLAHIHGELGGFGMAQHTNAYHMGLLDSFNSTLAKAVGATDPVGFRVRADMRKSKLVSDLDEAMRTVTQKNGPEFIRLFNQLMGVMQAQTNAEAAG